MLVLCQYCKSQSNKVDKENAVRIDNKNFHSNCAKLYLDKKELQETICRIFNLKAPGPKNNAYISKFHNEGMTFKGMTHTLVYFYDIKKNSIEKSNDGIGIIPYVYDEARKFYEKDQIAEKKAEAALEKNKEQREQIKDTVREVKWPKTTPVTFNMKVYNDSDIEW